MPVVLTPEDFDGDVARLLLAALDAELAERCISESPLSRCSGIDLP